MKEISSISKIMGAVEFAAQRHCNQRRKGPGRAPYVNHLIEVAALLARVAEVQDVELLCASVLHDVLEDTDTTSAELAGRFGATVLELVQAVTDDKRLTVAERRARILEHLSSSEDEIKLIKLADLCSNVSSIPGDWSVERRREYFTWADDVARLCKGVSAALDAEYETRARASRADTHAER